MTVVLFGFIGSWNSLAWPMLVTTTPTWRPISYGLLSFLDEAGAQVPFANGGFGNHHVADYCSILLYTEDLHRQHCHFGIEGVRHDRIRHK
jgi:hypothetical protein